MNLAVAGEDFGFEERTERILKSELNGFSRDLDERVARSQRRRRGAEYAEGFTCSVKEMGETSCRFRVRVLSLRNLVFLCLVGWTNDDGRSEDGRQKIAWL